MKTKFLIVALISSQYLLAQFKVIAYLPNWVNLNSWATKLDYTKITHLNIAFKNPNSNGDLVDGNDDGLDIVVRTAHENNVKVMVSLCGGANSEDVKKRTIWLDLIKENKVEAFADKIVKYVLINKLDGVDVDLEGPAINDDYGFFIEVLSKKLKPKGLLLTAALSQSYGAGKIKNTTLPYFDWINIMAYDQAGSWSAAAQHSSFDYAKVSLNYWTFTRGVSKDKLILGVPFYGYGWNTDAGNWSYNSIMNKYASESPENVDKIGSIIYYNGIPTITQKTDYAKLNCAGIMIWDITNDYTVKEKSLLNAINKSILKDLVNTKPNVKINFTPTGNNGLITFSASDPNDKITAIQLWINNTMIVNKNNSSSSYNWKGILKGNHVMVARAFDSYQEIAYSDTIKYQSNFDSTYSFVDPIPVIPCVIEAENYMIGLPTKSYYDNSTSNQLLNYRLDDVDIDTCDEGGYMIGNVESDEWTKYIFESPDSGLYQIRTRMMTTTNFTRKFSLIIDDTSTYNVVSLINPGNWQSVIINDVFIKKGNHTLKLAKSSSSVYYNNFKIYKNNEVGLENQYLLNEWIGNPISDEFKISFDYEELTFYTLNGNHYKTVYKGESLSTTDWLKGIYFVKIRTKDKVLTKKLIKS